MKNTGWRKPTPGLGVAEQLAQAGERLPDQNLWAIEVKRTTNPKVTRGFHIAADELDVAERLLVYAGDRDVPGQGGLRAMPLAVAIEKLRAL